MSLAKQRRLLAETNREITRARKDLEDVRMKLVHERKKLRSLKTESKKILNTDRDLKLVYLTDYSGEGIGSTLVGRIDGDRFIWHKPFLDMMVSM